MKLIISCLLEKFWFCRLYNKVLPRITDEKLKQDVQAFIRQEAMHANAHTSANKEYLSARNIDIQRNLDIMNYLFTTALADKPLTKKFRNSCKSNGIYSV